MKRRSIEVDATLLLTATLSSGEQFGDFVQDFTESFTACRPQYWGYTEPINKPLDIGQIRCELDGYKGILWKRKTQPKAWGEIRKRITPSHLAPKHANHGLYVSAQSEGQVQDLLKYLKHVAQAWGVDYACCESPSPEYRDAARMNGFAPTNGSFFIFTHTLARCLPDVLWAQIFGPPYIDLFGLEKLRSAPAYKVEVLSDDAVYIQLTESLFDVHTDPDGVREIRSRVRSHLNNNIFFDPTAPADHAYRTPRFLCLDASAGSR